MRLKISSPAGFNDPFEFVPLFTSPRSDVLADGAIRIGWPPDTAKKFSALLSEAWGGEETAYLQAFHQKLINDAYGVICLSGKNDNLLMWAHYADNHRGFCIGFDFSKAPIPLDVSSVTYSNDRPELDTEAMMKGLPQEDRARRVIFTKSKDWEYEDEFRAFVGNLPVQRPVFYFITPLCVRSIILGLRSETELESRIRQILNGPEFAHVCLFRATMHASKFALELVAQ